MAVNQGSVRAAEGDGRLMAIVGFMYTMIIGLYWLPYWTIWGAHSSNFPMDIQKRSYLMNGLCGPGTDRACPDPNVPLFPGGPPGSSGGGEGR